ncbi:MAG: hypothetical protein IJ677_06955 [Alphaproteobacteria bacterium]|nr:hypothetical protein [Alphaproteobacteria bacterium]
MGVDSVEENSVDLNKTLKTFMALNERALAIFGKKAAEKLYAHSWQEVNAAFEDLLNQTENETLKANMKKRFESLQKENFAQNTIETEKDAGISTPEDTVKEIPVSSTEKNVEEIKRPEKSLPETDKKESQNIHEAPVVDSKSLVKQTQNSNKDEVKLKEITTEVNDYIYGKNSRYSSKITDFAKDKNNALRILSHLSAEFARHPKREEAKIKLGNLTKLAIVVGAKNIADDDLKKALGGLLHAVSQRCQKDFIKFETQKEDFKDNFVVYLSSSKNEEMAEFLHNIYEEHAKGLYGKLDDNFKPKYQKWINDFSEKLEKKQAKVSTDAIEKSNRDKNNEGDTTMADENNGTPKTEETAFTPSDIQKAACEYAGIKDVTKFKSSEELISAVEAAGFKINGNQILKIDGGEVVKEINEEKKNDVNSDNPTEERKENKVITVDGEKKEEQKTNEEAPELADWIKKKIQDYQNMAEGKIEDTPKLDGYKHDETIKDGFAADFNGGHIHYTAPDNVIVSKESGLIVFETLVTEPDNKGRPVNFGPNLDHEQAVKLMAACLLHDNPIGENAPKLSVEDLKAIEAELKDRPEDLKKFQEKAAAYVQTQQNTDANESQPNAFDDETKKQVKEALEHQYKLSALEAKGVVEKDDNKKIVFGDDGNPKKSALADQKDYDEYIELRNKTIKVDDKEIGEKEFLAQKFVENPGEVRELVNTIVNDMHKEKINALRDKMAKTAVGDSNQLAEHDKRILALSGRLKEGDNVTKNGEKQEVKALEGEAKERFEARNKDAIARAMENYKSNTK